MKVHLLVEGPGERAFFRVDRPSWGQRFFAGFRGCQVEVHAHQGRGVLPDAARARREPRPRSGALLDLLPAKLRAYADARDARDLLIVVLVDADEDDCVALKQGIAAIAAEHAPGLRVLVRVAVRETEAYYLGDWSAIRRAYPDATRATHRRYLPRASPEIGTCELFAEVIGESGFEDKPRWAERVGVEMSLDEAGNRSPSFKALVRGLKRELSPAPPAAPLPPSSRPRPKRFHHAAKER